jgi:hypothetical protein
MTSFIGKAILAFALLAPAALPAFQDHDRDQKSSQAKRYYDSKNKDWHDWNDGENQSYQRYTQETHGQNREFDKLSKKQQQNYFKWRHDHMDDKH